MRLSSKMKRLKLNIILNYHGRYEFTVIFFDFNSTWEFGRVVALAPNPNPNFYDLAYDLHV